MKSVIRWMFALGCIVVLVASVSAQNKSALGAGAEINHLWATGKVAVIDILDSGVTTCIGGQPAPTADDPWACSPETRVNRVRGAVLLWEHGDLEGPAAEMFNGFNKTVNNWNANSIGGSWGTLEMTIYRFDGSCYGKWEGTFASNAFGRGLGSWTFVGHGSDGLEGLQMKGEGYQPENQDYQVFTVRVEGKDK